VSDDLVQSADQKICERRRFTISELPQISRTVLYKNITVSLAYHRFCATWVPEMLMGMHKIQRMTSYGFGFVTAIPQRWR
jgi:oligoribonuclease (3'-5' exoribonuclease)